MTLKQRALKEMQQTRTMLEKVRAGLRVVPHRGIQPENPWIQSTLWWNPRQGDSTIRGLNPWISLVWHDSETAGIRRRIAQREVATRKHKYALWFRTFQRRTLHSDQSRRSSLHTVDRPWPYDRAGLGLGVLRLLQPPGAPRALEVIQLRRPYLVTGEREREREGETNKTQSSRKKRFVTPPM